jgi:hypothetical protein
MEKSSQIAWKIVPLRHFFPLKIVPLNEVLLYLEGAPLERLWALWVLGRNFRGRNVGFVGDWGELSGKTVGFVGFCEGSRWRSKAREVFQKVSQMRISCSSILCLTVWSSSAKSGCKMNAKDPSFLISTQWVDHTEIQ